MTRDGVGIGFASSELAATDLGQRVLFDSSQWGAYDHMQLGLMPTFGWGPAAELLSERFPGGRSAFGLCPGISCELDRENADSEVSG